jgi:hypothetical protein
MADVSAFALRASAFALWATADKSAGKPLNRSDWLSVPAGKIIARIIANVIPFSRGEITA